MLIFVDYRFPPQALTMLKEMGSVVMINHEGITYPAISGHPDVFFCFGAGRLVVAPNASSSYIDVLNAHGIGYTIGENMVGQKYPGSVFYNAFVNHHYLVHNLKYTEKQILEVHKEKEHIHVKQAYTRCSLVETAGLYITGDKGIEKKLKAKGLDVFLVDNKQVSLYGMKNGFIGGCFGTIDEKLFVCGNLTYLNEGRELTEEIKRRGIHIIPLCDGKLMDVGGILFLKNLSADPK